jgi:hypothetical protein
MDRILLASHGSRGAIAAEQTAIQSCQPADQIHHLYVIPSWWADMTGDDWLNNGISRNRFRNYLENELSKESDETICRIRRACEEKQLEYTLSIVVGSSEKTLHELASNSEYQRIFLGEIRPKNISGLNDKMLSRRNRVTFKNELTIIPYPDG